jgi:hypothetical protein
VLGAIAEQNSKYGLALADYILEHPNCEIAGQLSVLLYDLSALDRRQAKNMVARSLASQIPGLCVAVAALYASPTWASAVETDDIRRLRGLLAHPDLQVRGMALNAVKRLAEHQPDVALNLAMSTDLNTNENVAAAFCSLFDESGGLSLASRSDEEQQAILEKLEFVLDSDDHTITEVLDYFAQHVPRDLVEALLRRIANADDETAWSMSMRSDWRSGSLAGIHARSVPWDTSCGMQRHPSYMTRKASLWAFLTQRRPPETSVIGTSVSIS